MFDIGWGELLLVGVVALIAIGPKELPTVMRSVGHWMGKIRRMASEFQGQFQEALREAEMDDLKKQAEDFTSAVTDATKFDPLADIDNDGDTGSDASEREPDWDEMEKAETGKADAEKAEADRPAAKDDEQPAEAGAAEPAPLPESETKSAAAAPPQETPETPEPVSGKDEKDEKDLAPADEPPPKQAGGKA
jgi:sec-independent protein translocase protein TatB